MSEQKLRRVIRDVAKIVHYLVARPRKLALFVNGKLQSKVRSQKQDAGRDDKIGRLVFK